MFVSQLALKSFAVLVFFVLPSASVVVAQQQEEDDENATLMTNYNALREEGQGFYLRDAIKLFERPGSIKVSIGGLYWFCDLEFSSDDTDTTNYGYINRELSISLAIL